MTEWYKFNSGNPNFTCIQKEDVNKLGFDEWKNNNTSFKSCQQCSACSGQPCSSLSQDREFYKLGTLKSMKSNDILSMQLYTFPLPLNQNEPIKIDEDKLPWMRSN